MYANEAHQVAESFAGTVYSFHKGNGEMIIIFKAIQDAASRREYILEIDSLSNEAMAKLERLGYTIKYNVSNPMYGFWEIIW